MKSNNENCKNDPMKVIHAYVIEIYNISEYFNLRIATVYPQYYSFINQTIIHKESCLTG